MSTAVETQNGHRPDLVAELEGVRPPARRIRGLRFPALPGGALMAQLGGGIGAAAGLYEIAGWGVTLLVAGVASAVLGMLHEAGKV